MDIVVGLGVLLVLEQAAYPLEFLFGAFTRVLLVFPVRGNTVLRGLVHLPRPDLDLERDALLADNRRMQGLIHVRLRRGDIVFEAAGDGAEQIVDMAEDIIAVRNVVHDHAEGIEVIELVDGFILGAHLAVDGIGVLDAAIDRAVDAHGGQTLSDLRLDGVHEVVGAFLVRLQIINDLLVALGIEVLE